MKEYKNKIMKKKRKKPKKNMHRLTTTVFFPRIPLYFKDERKMKVGKGVAENSQHFISFESLFNASISYNSLHFLRPFFFLFAGCLLEFSFFPFFLFPFFFFFFIFFCCFFFSCLVCIYMLYM